LGPAKRTLAIGRNCLRIRNLEDVPRILPPPRTRRHSYNLITQYLLSVALEARVERRAGEAQTIINMAGSEIEAASGRGSGQGSHDHGRDVLMSQ